MNKILEPGGQLIYARGEILLRHHTGFLGLWRRSFEKSEEGDKYSAWSLVEVFDTYRSADAIECAVEEANQ